MSTSPRGRHDPHVRVAPLPRPVITDRGALNEPSLVVVGPDSMRGETFAVREGGLTIGRALDNDVRLDDPCVSRQHARIQNASGHLMLADANSTAGLYVNAVRVVEPLTLRNGDLIQIGSVELEVTGVAQDASGNDRTAVFTTIQASDRHFDVQSQHGGVISNVAGNQYNTALRLEPMRRRARLVMRLGFLLFLSGFAIALIGWFNWMTPILNCSGLNSSATSCGNPNASAFLTFAAGAILLFIGLITMITSLFMKRRVRRHEA